jgi:hypothetical protein
MAASSQDDIQQSQGGNVLAARAHTDIILQAVSPVTLMHVGSQIRSSQRLNTRWVGMCW